MIKLRKLIFITSVLLFSSCEKDGDKLVSTEGYNVGTYFVKGNYNETPIFETNFFPKDVYDISDVYDEINIFRNIPLPINQNTDIDIHFNVNVGDFNIRRLQLNDVTIESLMSKRFSFDEAFFANQTMLNINNINTANSYLDIDTVIMPGIQYAYPRIVGNLYLESNDTDLNKLEIDSFEVPFDNK